MGRPGKGQKKKGKKQRSDLGIVLPLKETTVFCDLFVAVLASRPSEANTGMSISFLLEYFRGFSSSPGLFLFLLFLYLK